MEINNKLKFKYNQILHFLFKERFKKKINFNFPKFITRVDLIKKIIKIKNFSSYLEIGCDNNQVFSQIAINDKVGVDPVSGGNFRGTSDLFFFNNVKKFDLIFIDGGHSQETVYKDWVLSQQLLDKDGVIYFDDYTNLKGLKNSGFGINYVVNEIDIKMWKVEIFRIRDWFLKDWGVLALRVVKIQRKF